MIRDRWNALRVGHHVLVHDESDPAMALIPGRVTVIEPAAGSNQITIRISPVDGPPRTVQPRRLAVHGDGDGAAERCWRCEVHDPAAAQVPRRVPVRSPKIAQKN